MNYCFLKSIWRVRSFFFWKYRTRNTNTQARTRTIIIKILCTNREEIMSSFSWFAYWEVNESFWIMTTFADSWLLTWLSIAARLSCNCCCTCSSHNHERIGRYNWVVLLRASNTPDWFTMITLLSSLSLLGTIENPRWR